MPKIKGPTDASSDFPEHPDDLRARVAGEKYRDTNIKVFVKCHPDALERLIGTYTDEHARQLLQDLREKFWSGDWEP